MKEIQKYRYIRVSTTGQNIARQEAKQHEDEQSFIDRISGTIPFRERPAAQQLLNALEGLKVAQVSVSSIDRLGRDSIDILSTIKSFTEAGVNIHIDNLGLDSLTKEGKVNHVFSLITSVMASVSEMERATLRERQEEGIAAAKARGDYKGRVKGAVESDDEVLAKYKAAVRVIKQNPALSLRKLAKLAEVAPNTIRKLQGIINKGSRVATFTLF